VTIRVRCRNFTFTPFRSTLPSRLVLAESALQSIHNVSMPDHEVVRKKSFLFDHTQFSSSACLCPWVNLRNLRSNNPEPNRLQHKAIQRRPVSSLSAEARAKKKPDRRTCPAFGKVTHRIAPVRIGISCRRQGSTLRKRRLRG
jgi:hypothetical protein